MGRMLIGWTIAAFATSFFVVQISRYLFGGVAGGAVNTVSPVIGIATWTAVGTKLAMKRFTEVIQEVRGKSADARDRLDSSERK
jgi:hypothetical protein